MLQFDALHAWKIKNLKGLSFHILLVTVCLVAMAGPYLGQMQVWLFIAFVGLSHYIQDWAKIKFTGRLGHHLVSFLADQALHVGFIALLFLTDLKSIGPAPNPQKTFFLEAYNSNTVIQCGIAVLAASYVCHYTILLFKIDYLKMQNANGVFVKWYGFTERALIVAALFARVSWLWIAAILGLRLILPLVIKNKTAVPAWFSSPAEVLASGGLGLATGLALVALS